MRTRAKGYTLVELIVAVAILSVVLGQLGLLMVTSMRVYSNGTAEVNLQTEAQQAILQLEDIMMGASVYIETPETRTHGSVDSDVVTVKTTAYKYDDSSGVPTGMEVVTYVIGLDFDVNDGEAPSDEGYGAEDYNYTRLMLSRTVGSNTSYSVLADGVRSFRVLKTLTPEMELDEDGNIVTDEEGNVQYVPKLDDDGNIVTDTNGNIVYITSEAATGYVADRVTVYLEMQNNKYHYTSSKDVYLRNQVGSGGPKIDFSTDPKYAYEINVRRIHTYDLMDYAPDGYEFFKFEDPDTYELVYHLDGKHPTDESGDVMQHVFTVNDSGISPTIKANIGSSDKLGDWDEKVDGAVMYCGTDKNFSTYIKLKVYTEPFSCPDMPLHINTYDSKRSYSSVDITGVCVCENCLPEYDIQWQLCYRPGNSSVTNAQYYYLSGSSISLGDSAHPIKVEDALNDISLLRQDVGRKITINNSGTSEFDMPAFNERSYISASTADFSQQEYMVANSGNTFQTEVNQTNDMNAIVFASPASQFPSTHATPYWTKVVQYGGYLRINCTLRFASSNTKQFNMYLYPTSNGTYPTNYQMQLLWSHISSNYKSDADENSWTLPDGPILESNVSTSTNYSSMRAESTIAISNVGTKATDTNWELSFEADRPVTGVMSISSSSVSCEYENRTITLHGTSKINPGDNIHISVVYGIDRDVSGSAQITGVSNYYQSDGAVNVSATSEGSDTCSYIKVTIMSSLPLLNVSEGSLSSDGYTWTLVFTGFGSDSWNRTVYKNSSVKAVGIEWPTFTITNVEYE